MPDTKIEKKADDEPTSADDVKISSTSEPAAETNIPADGHPDIKEHDFTKESEGDKVKPDAPSNVPEGITGTGELPPKSSGAGVDPEVHVLDEKTGLTATGSDHPGEGMKSEPLPPGQTATLDNYTAEAGAVASTPVKTVDKS